MASRVLAMASALALREYLAGAIIAWMLRGGAALVPDASSAGRTSGRTYGELATLAAHLDGLPAVSSQPVE